MNDKELLGINMEKSYKPSFYDRYIRQKRIRLDMILAVFFMILIQFGIYYIVRYMTSTKHRNDYMSNVIEFNSSHPVYSSYPRMFSNAPSNGFYSHYSKPKVNLGISGDSMAANRLVNQVAEAMVSKDNRNYALNVGDIEVIEEQLDKSDLYKGYYNGTRGYPTKPLPTPTTPEQIIHMIDTKDSTIEAKKYMYDVDRDAAKLLRSGGIKPSPTSSNNSDDDDDDDDYVTTMYQFNPKLYPKIHFRLTSQGIRVRANITIRQELPLLNNNNKDVFVKLTQSVHDNKLMTMNSRLEDGGFSFYIHQNYNSFIDYNHVTDMDIVAEIIFPSQIKKYSSINLELYQGYSHFDQSLQNIAFESIHISTFYGAVVAEYLKTQKLMATFFYGYFSGLYEVSKDFGVSTYYGKIKPIIKCSSGDVHILTAARYGTVSNFIEQNSYRGDIDIQSYENKPSISSIDVSSFSDSVVKSNSPPRLQTSYKSRLSDSHILVSAGINADLTFGNINP